MNGTHSVSTAQAFPALRRSYRLGDRAKALREALRRNDGLAFGAVSALPPSSAPHAALELATAPFRHERARVFRANAAAARATLRQLKDLYARWVSVGVSDFGAMTAQVRELESRAKWHEQRAGAQLPRFSTIRACGTKTLNVSCRVCDSSLCEKPCTCGVVRVCESCAEIVAVRRQKRIAAARVEAMADGADRGLFDRGRFGGAFSEKMLTLTVPHVELSEATGLVAEACAGIGLTSTVNARIVALRLAWPRFIRRVRAWLAGKGKSSDRRRGDPNDSKRFAFYRLLEWTRGTDGKGHPHFHVYLFSPWLNVRLLRRWWAQSLEAVGVPLPRACADCRVGLECSAGGVGAPHVMLDLRRLDGFNWSALKELVKNGDRRAIEAKLGTMRTPGDDAITYALAWTMGDAFEQMTLDVNDPYVVGVQRDLFCALEGRRLAQGSRGFLLAPPVPVCACCGGAAFVAAVEYGVASACVDSGKVSHDGRGPPDPDEGEREHEQEEERRRGAA